MTFMRWDAKYDMNGRRRKQKKPKGEVFQKLDKSKLKGTTVSEPYRRDAGVSYPSAPMSGGIAAKKESIQYSGDRNLLGISILHKSCLQPVFDKQTAIDNAKMRR